MRDPEFLMWAFQHSRDVLPSELVARGSRMRDLPRANRDLSDFAYEHAGETLTLAQAMADTFVDGLMVLHDGAVVFEYYDRGMGPETLHICQSVSKTITAALAGVLVGRGALSTEDLVTQHLPEFTGSVWDGST